MTDNVLITLACGTDNPNRATRALFLAATAQKKGKNVTVFLLDDAVEGFLGDAEVGEPDRHNAILAPHKKRERCLRRHNFEGAGLGQGLEIAAGEDVGNGLLLHRGGRGVALLANGAQELGRKAEVGELHIDYL